jgi:hypothetical protein
MGVPGKTDPTLPSAYWQSSSLPTIPRKHTTFARFYPIPPPLEGRGSHAERSGAAPHRLPRVGPYSPEGGHARRPAQGANRLARRLPVDPDRPMSTVGRAGHPGLLEDSQIRIPPTQPAALSGNPGPRASASVPRTPEWAPEGDAYHDANVVSRNGTRQLHRPGTLHALQTTCECTNLRSRLARPHRAAEFRREAAPCCISHDPRPSWLRF